MGCQQVEQSIFEIRAVDVHTNDFSDCQVLLEWRAICAMQLDNLHELAFKRRRSLCYPRRSNHPAGSGCQLRKLEFVHTVWQGSRVRFIFSASGRVTRLQTNSPVAWTFATVSFHPAELNMTIGGRSHTALKKL